MKILDERRSPNPRRVRVYLAEKGIEVEFEQVDIMTGAHKTAEFAKANPFQRVPVLVLDSGEIITETIAICRYFEALQPEPSLFGRTPLEIATIEMWARRAELNLLLSIAMFFRHSHPAAAVLESPQVPEWAEVNKPRVGDYIRLFDKHLTDHRYLAGENFSVADITAMIAVNFMKPARLAIPDGAENFKRWYSDVMSRPSAAA